MLYYAYKLVRGTAAIIVFRGFVIIYAIWWITDLLNMNILSSILGGFIGVGVFAVIIVFQQEIRKFLLLLGSSRITNNKSLWKRFNLFFKISKEQSNLNIDEFLTACNKLKKDKTGAIFVFERNNNLDFVKEDGDIINAVHEALIQSACTGQIGDGKIFVFDLHSATRIRTGETENNAL